MPTVDILIRAIDQASAIIAGAQRQVEAATRSSTQISRQAATARAAEANAQSRVNTLLDLSVGANRRVQESNAANLTTWQRLNGVLAESRVLFTGLLGVLASAPASLIALGASAVRSADDLGKAAQQVGIATQTLSALKFAASQNEVDFSSLKLALKQLAEQVENSQDPASESAEAFRVLGVSVRDAAGNLKGNDQLIREIADGFTRLDDGAGKSRIAVQLFGRAAQGLIPFLNSGSQGIAELEERARDLGITVSSDFARQADTFNDTLAEFRAVLQGIGQSLAIELLPTLTAFLRTIIENKDVVRTAFLGIAIAVTAVATAAGALKIFSVVNGLIGAFIGPAALAQITGFRSGLAAIGEAAANLAIRFRLVGVTATGALAATPFGAALAALATLTAGILAAREGWKAYRAAQQEALSTQNLTENNQGLRAFAERQIREFEAAGKITGDKADELRERLARAFTPKDVGGTQTTFGPTGFATQRVSKLELDQRAASQEAAGVVRELRNIQEAQSAVNETATQAVITEKNLLAQAQAQLEIFKATKELQLAELAAEFNRAGSTLTADQFASQSEQIISEIFARERAFIETTAQREIEEARRKLTTGFDAIKDPAERAAKVEAELAGQQLEITSKRDAALAQKESEFNQQLLSIRERRADQEIAAAQSAAQNRLSIATLTNNELLAAELQLQQQLNELRARQQNLAPGQRLSDSEIEQAGAFAFRRLRAQQEQKDTQTSLDLEFALLDAERARLNNDPTPNLALRQEQLNDVLRRYNALIEQEINLQQEALRTGTLTVTEQTTARQRLIEAETRLIENRRALNLRDAQDRNLPQFSAELGFQNRLDQFGNATGEREIVAPFRALDDFLTGTLQTTFRGLGDSITGLITGTARWGQVWVQVGNQIIGQVVNLVLEYTLFHTIRMALDRIFHTTSRANIAATQAVGTAAQAATTAASATSAATTAAAWAPASAAVNTATFGSSAGIGLAIALAAIAAIIGALAFAEGGYIRGPGGPKEDKVLVRVSSGEGITNAAATQRYGGKSFIDAVNDQRLESFLPGLFRAMPVPEIRFDPGQIHLRGFAEGGFIGAPTSQRELPTLADSGFSPNVNVSPAPVNVAVLNNREELRQWLASADAGAVIFDHVRRRKLELGVA